MKVTSLVAVVAAPLLTFALMMPSRAADSANPTTCKDGTTSAATGKGACSGHGGVQKSTQAKSAAAGTGAATPPAAAPAATTPPPAASSAKSAPATTKSAPTTAAGNTDPTGATATCKDGAYSKSQHHSGTCSSHGGVAEWLTPSH